VPVLIVGGGGAGLTASMLLSHLGVVSLLVSSLPTTSVLPKAHVLGQRAMEILDDCGAAEDIYASGTPPEQLAHTAFYAGFAGHPDAGRVLCKQESWGGGGADPDWVAASPLLTTNLPQIRLEPIMKAHAERLAPGRIRFHHELKGLQPLDDGVLVTVIDHGTGSDYQVKADYVLACDGGRTIGPMLGVEMVGPTDLTRTATAHLSADLSPWADDDDVLLRWIWCPSNGKLAVLAPMGPTRWGGRSEEWVCHLNYEIDDPRAFDDGAVLDDLRSALGIGDHPLEIHLVTRWTIGGVVASSFRKGRVFFLGDAAHRHPPTGGLGLTSAIHDAHNLCWKLALVLQEVAGDGLLDTYESERRPVDQRNVDRSLENALGYITMGEVLGMDATATPEARWSSLRRLWSDKPEDEAFRRTAFDAMAAQSQEFHEHDVEYGYLHRSSAVVDDGSPEPAPHDFRYFVPSTRPGSPLPHAWVERYGEPRVSTLSLVKPGRFLVIAGERGGAWCQAACAVAHELGIPLDTVTIGHAAGELHDPRLRWMRVREFGPEGAILVRPDRGVAWRSLGSSEDAARELRSALRRILAVHDLEAGIVHQPSGASPSSV